MSTLPHVLGDTQQMAATSSAMGDSESLAIFDEFTRREIGYFILGLSAGIALTAAGWEVHSVRTRGTSRFFGERGDMIWRLLDMNSIRVSLLRQAAAVVVLTVLALPLAITLLLWEVLHCVSSLVILCLWRSGLLPAEFAPVPGTPRERYNSRLERG